MPEVSPPPPWPCSGESSRPVSLQPSECVHTGDSCERGTLCSRCSTVAPRRSAAASAPLQALLSLLGVEAAVLTEAGDLQRQVPPLSQSHTPPPLCLHARLWGLPSTSAGGSTQNGAAVPGAPGDSPWQGARPARAESRDSQDKTGVQVSLRRVCSSNVKCVSVPVIPRQTRK